MNRPVLIILPGWGGTQRTWSHFTALAKQTFDVIVIDLPCFGNEPCPKTAWGVEEYADFAAQKIRTIAREARGRSIVLLGHSFGGAVAAHVAAAHPDLITHLVLSGAALFRPKKTIHRALFGGIAKMGKYVFALPGLRRLAPEAKKALYRTADSPDYAKTGGIQRDIFKKIIRQDSSHIAPRIRQHTLLIWGECDTYVPLRYGKKIADLIPNAKLHIIPGAPHGLHLHCPQRLLKAVAEHSARV